MTVHPPLGPPETRARTSPRPRPPSSRGPGSRGVPPDAPARLKATKGRKPGIFWRYRRIWFLLGFLAFTALAGAVWVITQIPIPSEAPLAQTTVIYDSTGAQIAELHGVENRFPVKLDQVPEVLQAAVIAAEDRHFLEHRGVDPVSILRATWADIRHKGATQGGSTITQQYVKNQIVGSERSLVRKLKEAVVAVKIDRKYGKKEILEKYLNTVYFGRGAYGVQAAARTYFAKDVNQLDLKESAYLAGLIRTPSEGDVFVDPATAYYLRTSVLKNMVKDRAITQADADAVEKIKIEDYVFAPEPADTTFSTSIAPGSEYFIDYVRQKLIHDYGEDRVFRGGLRVYTTLDPKVQGYAYNSVYGTLDNAGKDPIGALVSLDGDGKVVAMVGNRDWNESQVNVATGVDGGGGGRQGGSAFKPFVLVEALKQGLRVDDKYYPAPAKIGPLPGWEEEVHNYGDTDYGYVNLIDATVNSVNTVYAQLVDQVGSANVVNTAHDLGITSKLNPVPSITLGTQEVSVLEMADAYLTLYRDGTHVDPRVVSKITEGGTVLLDDKPTGQRRAIPREVAQKVREILGQVVERGTGTQAKLPGGAWGKTGTTEEYGDAWFVGANDKLVTAVWMGYPEGQSRQLLNVHGVNKVTGGSLPAYIFEKFMLKAAPSDPKTPVTEPILNPAALNGAANHTATTGAPAASATASTTPAPPTTLAAPPATVAASPTTTAPPTILTAPTVATTPPTTDRRQNNSNSPPPTSFSFPDFPSFPSG